jgi:hypothetical protein
MIYINKKAVELLTAFGEALSTALSVEVVKFIISYELKQHCAWHYRIDSSFFAWFLN